MDGLLEAVFRDVFLGGDLVEALSALGRLEPATRSRDVADQRPVDLGARLTEDQSSFDAATAKAQVSPQGEMLIWDPIPCEAKRGCQRGGIDIDSDSVWSNRDLGDENRRSMDGGVITGGNDLHQIGDAVAQPNRLSGGQIRDHSREKVGSTKRVGYDPGDRLLERSGRKSPAGWIRRAALFHQAMRHIVPMPDTLLVRMARRQPIPGLIEEFSR